MNAKKWNSSGDPGPMLEFVCGTASNRKLRLFAVACCRPLLTTRHHYHAALDVAEEVAEGKPKRWLLKSLDEWSTMAMEAGDPLGYAIHHALDDDALAHLDREFTDWVCGLREGFSERAERKRCAGHLRCLFGSPFRPIDFDPGWRTSDTLALARGIYEKNAFDRMPILADALQDAGCDNADILGHCRDTSLPHVRGCWVVDLVLGKT
jgi:hypothetical protein